MRVQYGKYNNVKPVEKQLYAPKMSLMTLPGGAGPPARAVGKSWVFTVNNYTNDDEENLQKMGSSEDVSYLIYGREYGAQGTPHLQGSVTFRKAMRRAAVAKLIPRAYLAIAKNVHRAREYCRKEDPEPFEADNRRQGHRSELSEVVDTLREHGLHQVVRDHPETFIKFHGGITRLSTHLQRPRDPSKPPEVVWLYGSTGVGKSRYVHSLETELWVSMGTHRWWEGYQQQAAMLIDDMRCNYAPFNELLKILDRYPYRAECKGGSIHVNSDRIYITSQFPPHKVYNRENRQDEDIRQLYRRISRVYKVGPPDTSDKPLPLFHFFFEGSWFIQQDKEQLLATEIGDNFTVGEVPISASSGFTPWL